MKIVHLCIQAPYNDYWGYQENLLPKYHQRSGHSVTIITTNTIHKEGKIEKIEPSEYNLNDGQHIIRLSYKCFFPKRLSTVLQYFPIYGVLERQAPDFIMVHGLNNISVLQVAKYKRRHPQCRIVADNHMDYYNATPKQGISSKLLGQLYRLLNRYMQKRYDKVYGVTPDRIKYQQNVFGIDPNKSALLVMGGDDEKIHFDRMPQLRAEIRKELDLSNEDFVIITGGKIDRTKNIHLLMEAVAELSDKVKLIVFGQPNAAMQDEINRLSKDKNIRFLGWIPSDKAYDYFLSSDLAVFPGTHSVLWEQACACGIPCVFKDWQGMHHIDIGGNCEFLHKDSKEEIKAVISEIISNKDKYNEMKQAAQKGIQIFSYNEIAKRAIGN